MTNAVRDLPYEEFLAAKVPAAKATGFEVAADLVNPALKPHCRAIVPWMLKGGRRAVFANFGLHKTSIQLEAMRLCRRRLGGEQLIVAPLGVRREFAKEQAARFAAPGFDVGVKFIRSSAEIDGGDHVYLTNYETVRDGKLDPGLFTATSLDEAAILRGFGGSKTFREFMRLFDGVPYRFVATATPSPNDYIELLAYSAYLGVMDIGEAKTRFFQRDSENADHLTLHPHKEREFWLWVASWACWLQRPSDLGFSDEGYVRPPVEVNWHMVSVDHRQEVEESPKAGRRADQIEMFRMGGAGLVDMAREKRATLVARVAKMTEILAASPDDHFILWHDLEDERRMIEAAVPTSVSIYGTQDLEEREGVVEAFSEGFIQHIAAKPVMLGAGTNLQFHCHRAVYVGVGPKFHDFIQSVHRIDRFGQSQPVVIDLIYAESERDVVDNLKRKWRQHEEAMDRMGQIIREFGLSDLDMAAQLTRAMGVKDRIEVSGEGYTLVNQDCVVETARMEADSVDLIVTSIPFSTQYEYSPNYADFGHTDDNDHFFQQMDYLVPQLYRVLKPGRACAIHVKDRITPSGLNGMGFQTVYPFADDVRAIFRKHGFGYLGEKTNLTDVVRENNQTYRLGWSEQCKDGTRQGAGLPEKVLLFRKPPTDRSNGYADKPVVKDKAVYTRPRWQVDANHLMRSAGDRLVTPEEWANFEEADQVYRLWRAFNLTRLYDFEHHVRIGEAIDGVGRLPSTFNLLPCHSWHPDVWTDVMQARSLNTIQSAAGAEKHLCPLPFDIVDRLITQMSEPGELVLDPFGGLMTTPYRALKLGRRGYGIELSPTYFLDGCKHVEAMAREIAIPTLYELIGERVVPADGAAA